MITEAIIFDKDGTLIDFDAFWVSVSVKALDTVLKSIDMDAALSEEILTAYGVTNGVTSIEGVLCHGTYGQMAKIAYEILCSHGYTGTLDELEKLLVAAYDESTDAGEIKPTCEGLRATLLELKKRGNHLAVVTTDNEVITRRCLGALGILELFDKIYTDDGVTPAKPDPFCAFDFAKYCGVDIKQVVMVGDTLTDVNFAKSAGIRSFGLARAEVNRRVLSGKADVIISEISELVDLIG